MLNHRAAYAAIISAILLCIGLFALRFPVFIDDYDQSGWQVNCGTGFTVDLTQATAAVGDKNFVDQCETALIVRRLWTIPLVAVGSVALLALLAAAAMTSARESLVGDRDMA